jgi:hypothetical protein
VRCVALPSNIRPLGLGESLSSMCLLLTFALLQEVCLALWASLSLSRCLESERAYVLLPSLCDALRQSVRLVLGTHTGGASTLRYTVGDLMSPGVLIHKHSIFPCLLVVDLRIHFAVSTIPAPTHHQTIHSTDIIHTLAPSPDQHPTLELRLPSGSHYKND